jgi:hypothetical protein
MENQKESICINVNGDHIAVFIDAKEKIDIERRYYSFWNHGATNGELHWVHSERAYFWTKHHKFKRALVWIVLFRVLNKYNWKYKGKKHGVMPLAKWLANRIMRNMTRVPAKYGINVKGVRGFYQCRAVDEAEVCSLDSILKEENGEFVL